MRHSTTTLDRRGQMITDQADGVTKGQSAKPKAEGRPRRAWRLRIGKTLLAQARGRVPVRVTDDHIGERGTGGLETRDCQGRRANDRATMWVVALSACARHGDSPAGGFPARLPVRGGDAAAQCHALAHLPRLGRRARAWRRAGATRAKEGTEKSEAGPSLSSVPLKAQRERDDVERGAGVDTRRGGYGCPMTRVLVRVGVSRLKTLGGTPCSSECEHRRDAPHCVDKKMSKQRVSPCPCRVGVLGTLPLPTGPLKMARLGRS
mmetsp:Transcript_25962/g.70216  ORF Transcript_25962/g.70216 Transcript_25962/m.70216 type:complete len:263 (-) Transcript_25962:1123-1911(-)